MLFTLWVNDQFLFMTIVTVLYRRLQLPEAGLSPSMTSRRELTLVTAVLTQSAGPRATFDSQITLRYSLGVGAVYGWEGREGVTLHSDLVNAGAHNDCWEGEGAAALKQH